MSIPGPGRSGARDASRESIRGSGVMVLGRIISLGVMCAVQVLAVRYLSRSDYGAWTWALSVVLVLQSVSALGLDRAITRFVSIYHERGDFAKLRGTVVLLLAVIAIVGGAIVLTVQVFPDLVHRVAGVDQEALHVLGVAILLVPLEALDLLLVGLLASLGEVRAIFIRRHVLLPCLRLAVVVMMVRAEADVLFLAYGYVAASVTAMLLYGPLLVSAARRLGLLSAPEARAVHVPARELFGFTLPLLTADLAGAVITGAGALTLGRLTGLEEVALFTAALPLAALNQTVMRNFALLYTPALSRLFARDDHQAINELYWRTAAWVAVLTFPVFAATCAASGAIVSLLYGPQYAGAAVILALLAFGEYVNVALGLNGLTLRVLGHVRYSVGVNVVTALAALAANALLVPSLGALGAGIATSGALMLHCVLKQLGLRIGTQVRPFDARYAPVYLAIGGGAGTTLGAQWLAVGHPAVPLLTAAAASLALVVFSKRRLMVSETFPEVMRVPVLRALFA